MVKIQGAAASGLRVPLVPEPMANWRGKTKRDFLVAVGIGGIVRLTGIGLTFLIGVLLARVLGVEQYGTYTTVVALTAILTPLVTLGLPQLITREIASKAVFNPEVTKGAVISFPFVIISAAFIVIFASILSMPFILPVLEPGLAQVLIWSLMALPFMALLSLAVGAIRATHRVVAAQAHDALIRPVLFVTLFLVVVMLLDRRDAVWAVIAGLGAWATAAAIATFHFLTVLPATIRSARPAFEVSEWAKAAVPMSATELLRTAVAHYPILFIGIFGTVQDAGVYRIAAATAGMLMQAQTLFTLTIMSHIAVMLAKGEFERLERLSSTASAGAFALTGSATCILFFFGASLIKFVFGPEYASAHAPLVILGVGYSVSTFFGSATTILNMGGHERFVTLGFLMTLVVSFVIALTLHGFYGAAGVAAAVAIGEGARNAFMWFLVLKFRKIDSSVAGFVRTHLKARSDGQ